MDEDSKRAATRRAVIAFVVAGVLLVGDVALAMAIHGGRDGDCDGGRRDRQEQQDGRGAPMGPGGRSGSTGPMGQNGPMGRNGNGNGQGTGGQYGPGFPGGAGGGRFPGSGPQNGQTDVPSSTTPSNTTPPTTAVGGV